MPRGYGFGIVRIDGVEGVVNRLKDIERRVLNKGLRDSYLPAAEIVREDAERRAPVRTRELAGNIVKEWDGRRKVARVGPRPSAWYGLFQELGTSRHPPQPFLRPALDANRGNVLRTIGEGLKRVIESRM